MRRYKDNKVHGFVQLIRFGGVISRDDAGGIDDF
jgi:hypothetical protein